MKFFLLSCLFLATSLSIRAADLIGQWTAEFDTQIGIQKYVYEFKQADGQLTGSANFDHSFGKGTVPLKAIKVDGNKVSFTEALNFDGNEVTITYTGTLSGDELKLTRQVGDIATEQLTAKRATATAAK